MKKLKWKRQDISLCTSWLRRHIVKGYIHGELGVHKVPDSKPTQWSITHIKTGLGCVNGVRIAFMKMDEVKDFATKLLSRDTWYIEGAEWGKASNKKRVASLNKILTEVLIAEGYKPDTRKYNPAEREVKLHKCSCGKIAKRYISSLDRTVKWENKCLNCEPHTKGRK